MGWQVRSPSLGNNLPFLAQEFPCLKTKKYSVFDHQKPMYSKIRVFILNSKEVKFKGLCHPRNICGMLVKIPCHNPRFLLGIRWTAILVFFIEKPLYPRINIDSDL